MRGRAALILWSGVGQIGSPLRCATHSSPINRSNANWLTSAKQAATLTRRTQSRLAQNMLFGSRRSGINAGCYKPGHLHV